MAAVEDYLEGHMKATPEGIKEMDALKGQFGTDKKAAARIFLAMGDRFLYEFFDEKKIYIHVEPYMALSTRGDGKGIIQWVPQIAGEVRDFDPADNRQQAEANAFGIALKILESKLG